ncbi:MAG: hypothetical protein JG769_606 [Oscillospiraceae bacterium]|jgi:cytoskeletal protein RodZ|nr:hypothetical protein [Oscillospiraceae bacterium]
MQKGGRKIKRTKNLYGSRRRNHVKNAVKAIVMILVIGGIAFLGYSIGEPVLNFLREKAQNPTSSTSSANETSSGDVSSKAEENSSESETSSSSTESSEGNKDFGFSAYEIKSESLLNMESLKAAVDQAKQQGYSAVAVVLKSPGGAVNYNTNVELAKKAYISQSQLSAADIAKAVNESGLKSVAFVGTLNDNLTPKVDKTAGYTFENSQTAWYDDSPEKGGKPWLNPFSETTKSFMTEIANEVCLAGFDEVICTGVAFPPFRNTDLNYIGTLVKDPNRYTALLNIADIFKTAAANTSSKVAVEISAKGLIEGTDEIFKPQMLEGFKIAVDYNPAKIGTKLVDNGSEIILTDLPAYDKAKKIFETAKAKAGGIEIIPCIEHDGANVGDVSETIRALVDLGYKNYIIKNF